MARRATIRDVAERAGVSTAAVSLAVNGRPGVSESTRDRILGAARDLGWAPSRAARSLAGGAGPRALGLAIGREALTGGSGVFHMAFVGGLESVLAEHAWTLLLHTTTDLRSEVDLYRTWWQSGRINGALLVGVVADDPRVPALHHAGVPTVAAAHPSLAGGLPAVWMDDATATTEAVVYLAALGHRRIAHVAGPGRFGSYLVRARAFAEATAGLESDACPSVPTDLSAGAGAHATRTLLSSPRPPTAILYDNDLTAVAGMSVAQEMGLRVPEDLSVVAGDDSELCRTVRPTLSALSQDSYAYGEEAARCLLELLDRGRAESRVCGAPVLVPRGTTAPPRPGTSHRS
ncbi:LacI family transcriptional regulator [Kitasatospora sp. NE20-6]|uniref:LacI family DNA-binding transcriptional regulator n=1 Tax=Kitasatospora sp. NE20-6 TaxID=2859066 RepID=UPI0034DC4364